MKKIFIISSAIFSLLLIILMIRSLLYENVDEVKNADKKKTISNIISSSETRDLEPLYPISDEKIASFFVDRYREKILYYSKDIGNVVEMDFDGRNKKVLSDELISGITEVAWSEKGGDALIKSNGKYFYHDYVLKTRKEIDAGVDMVSWSEDFKNIYYRYFGTTSATPSISRSDPDGLNWIKIIDIGYKNVKISPIPTTGLISFWNSPRSTEETSLEIIYPISNEKKKLFSSRFGADYKWSPDGKMAIVSFSKDGDAKTMSSGIISIEGIFTDLSVPMLASKTVWSLDGKTVFYAAPSFPEGTIVPDDYESGKVMTKDTFWKLNTEDGKKERLVDLGSITTETDAANLAISPNSRSLFFINKRDGFIYRLDF